MARRILCTIRNDSLHPGCDAAGPWTAETGDGLLAAFDLESVCRGGHAIDARATMISTNSHTREARRIAANIAKADGAAALRASSLTDRPKGLAALPSRYPH